MKLIIYLIAQLHRYYPALTLTDIIIAALEELLAQQNRNLRNPSIVGYKSSSQLWTSDI